MTKRVLVRTITISLHQKLSGIVLNRATNTLFSLFRRDNGVMLDAVRVPELLWPDLTLFPMRKVSPEEGTTLMRSISSRGLFSRRWCLHYYVYISVRVGRRLCDKSRSSVCVCVCVCVSLFLALTPLLNSAIESRSSAMRKVLAGIKRVAKTCLPTARSPDARAHVCARSVGARGIPSAC